MTTKRCSGLRRACLAVAAGAFAAMPALAADADSGVMFERLRHLRRTEPTLFAAYVLSQLRAVSEIAAACGWAASDVVDATVDGVIVHLDTHLGAQDVPAARLRRHGLDVADAVPGRPVAAKATDLAAEPCEREGRRYRDWVVFGELAGQPAAPLPTTPPLAALVAAANDGPRARAAFAAGVMLVTVAERAAGCRAAEFARVQAFEETATRSVGALLRSWGEPVAVAAGVARLVGSERVRSEAFDAGRLDCADPRVGADWRLWAPFAHDAPNFVELVLAVSPAFAAKVAAARAAACGPAAAAAHPVPAPPPPATVTVSATAAARAERVVASRAFAQAVDAHAHGGGCPPATGRR